MFSYFKFHELWEDLPTECEPKVYLDKYLRDTYWASILTEKEIKQLFPQIVAMREARTFSDFLEAAMYAPEAFVDIFKVSEKDVSRWMSCQTVYPERLKKTYAFMICTNYLEYSRFRICKQCGEAFSSRDTECICESCKQYELVACAESIAPTDEQTIKFEIELVCKKD